MDPSLGLSSRSRTLSLYSSGVNFFVLQPDSEVHIHWKGAAELVLASCTKYIDTDDQVVPMDEDKV